MTTRGHKGPRLFVEDLRALLIASPSPTLPAEESHYLRDVLRLKTGDSVEIADPKDGLTCIATLSALQPLVTFTPNETIENSSPALLRILLIALCKGQKNELICDWATELGCTHIAFWQATRSIVRLKNQKDAESKRERLDKIAVAAAQQSRQLRPPTISVHLSLDDALKALPTASTKRICCSLSAEASPIASLASRTPDETGWTLAVGPEGDLTSQEEEHLVAQGFLRASLGPTILRSELATVTALASLAVAK
jgi:16S rRNA (uracil1498-N3)-methyltransferase